MVQVKEDLKQDKKDFKKKEYAPYRTAWFLADNRDLDKQILEIAEHVQDNNYVRYFPTKALMVQYFVYLYLSFSRRTDPFRKNPRIEHSIDYIEENGEKTRVDIYEVHRVDSKHFKGAQLSKSKIKINDSTQKVKNRSPLAYLSKPHRVLLDQTFVAFSIEEKKLWKILLGDKEQVTLDFTPLILPNLEPDKRNMFIKRIQNQEYKGKDAELDNAMSSLTQRVASIFKSNLRDNNGKEVKTGITPHMLRHLRSYDQLIIKDLPDGLVRRNVNWSIAMLDHYENIKLSLQKKEMIDIYKNKIRNKRVVR